MLVLSKLIKLDEKTQNAVRIASKLWSKALSTFKDEKDLYNMVDEIQSKLEEACGCISTGKYLTVYAGLLRFYEFKEKDTEMIKIVGKALRGHCMEMDATVRDILSDYSIDYLS